jgi:RNA polymerase sigma-70 factor (ECF subfamily)
MGQPPIATAPGAAGRPRADDIDDVVFEELYPALRRLASIVAGPSTDPDDLVQEALARVLAHGNLSDLDAPLPYLARTIINVARTQRRRDASHQRAMAMLAPAEPVEPHYPSELDFLAALAPETRTALMLVDLEGHSYRYASELLGVSQVALRARVSRARRQLRKSLLERGET